MSTLPVRANVAAAPAHHHHGAPQALFPQYEDIDQQNESYIVGMWTFLVTEIMFFGALFLLYAVYRTLYPDTYLEAHEFLNIGWGTLNTFALLTSSFTMVMAVWAAQQGKKGLLITNLLITIALSFVFLGVKYIEYTTKINEGLFPGYGWNYAKAWEHHEHEKAAKGGAHAGGASHSASSGTHSDTGHGAEHAAANPAGVSFDVAPKEGFNASVATLQGTDLGHAVLSAEDTRMETRSNRAKLFFSVYFTMTGLHGIHVLVGIILMSVIIVLRATNHHLVMDYMPTELVGLYWHFVDIVWIFLFPMMYLIS